MTPTERAKKPPVIRVPKHERTTLVKALHTVTTVGNLAAYIVQSEKFKQHSPKSAVLEALKIVNEPGPWPDDDPVVLKSIARAKQLIDAAK